MQGHKMARFQAVFLGLAVAISATEAAGEEIPISEIVSSMSRAAKSVSPPISEDEVVAAITFYREHHEPLSREDAAVLSEILLQHKVPQGTRIELAGVRDNGGNVIYRCEDVSLFLRLSPRNTLNIPIRSKIIRAIPVAEVAENLRAFLETPASYAPGRHRATSRLLELKSRISDRN